MVDALPASAKELVVSQVASYKAAVKARDEAIAADVSTQKTFRIQESRINWVALWLAVVGLHLVLAGSAQFESIDRARHRARDGLSFVLAASAGVVAVYLTRGAWWP